MNYAGYSYMVLCEDKRQYYFVQSYLRCKGVNPRRIRSFGLPGGGDAKQFVETNYQNALRTIRKNEKNILIVVRDADRENYDDVIKKFGGSVSFIVIPKRHIETWYYYLDNPELTESNDEIRDRKKDYPKTGVKPTVYGEKLELVINKMKQGRVSPNIPDSLSRTIKCLLECE